MSSFFNETQLNGNLKVPYVQLSCDEYRAYRKTASDTTYSPFALFKPVSYRLEFKSVLLPNGIALHASLYYKI